MKEDRRFYVYVHIRAVTGEPFYYGKGCGTRAWDHFQKGCRSEWWLKVAKKHGVLVKIIQDNLTNEEAKVLEIKAIADARSRKENIVNIHPGGDGFDSETAKRIVKKQWENPEHRKRMKEVHVALAKLDWRKEQLAKASELRNTKEVREKCSKTHKELSKTEERKVQLSKAWGAAHTEKAKAKRSTSMSKIANSEEGVKRFVEFQRIGSSKHAEKLRTDKDYADKFKAKLREGWIKRKQRGVKNETN